MVVSSEDDGTDGIVSFTMIGCMPYSTPIEKINLVVFNYYLLKQYQINNEKAKVS
jgi:hypothetical protein